MNKPQKKAEKAEKKLPQGLVFGATSLDGPLVAFMGGQEIGRLTKEIGGGEVLTQGPLVRPADGVERVVFGMIDQVFRSRAG